MINCEKNGKNNNNDMCIITCPFRASWHTRPLHYVDINNHYDGGANHDYTHDHGLVCSEFMMIVTMTTIM